MGTRPLVVCHLLCCAYWRGPIGGVLMGALDKWLDGLSAKQAVTVLDGEWTAISEGEREGGFLAHTADSDGDLDGLAVEDLEAEAERLERELAAAERRSMPDLDEAKLRFKEGLVIHSGIVGDAMKHAGVNWWVIGQWARHDPHIKQLLEESEGARLAEMNNLVDEIIRKPAMYEEALKRQGWTNMVMFRMKYLNPGYREGAKVVVNNNTLHVGTLATTGLNAQASLPKPG